MPPENGNRPGGGAAHSVGNKSSNAAESSQPPDYVQAARRVTAREKAAAFILAEAAKLDLRIGTDGCDLLIAPPRGMPSESYFSFQRAIIEHRDEIIDIIMQGGRA